MESVADKPRLRLGLIVPGGPWPRWLQELLPALGTRVVAVRSVPAPARARGLFGLYRALDDHVFGRADDAFALQAPMPGEQLLDNPLPVDLDAILWLADGPVPSHQPARLGVWTWNFAAGWSRAAHYVYLPEDRSTYQRSLSSDPVQRYELHEPTDITSQ